MWVVLWFFVVHISPPRVSSEDSFRAPLKCDEASEEEAHASALEVPMNPRLGNAALTTVISRGMNVSSEDPSLARLLNRGGGPVRAIMVAFKTIANMADRLSLVSTIKDWACEIYRRLEDQTCTKGRNLDALVAGCIYMACYQEGKPRPVEEIISIVAGARKKEIDRVTEFIVKQLKLEMGESMEMGTIHATFLFYCVTAVLD
ncbi:Transcription initiation factor IIB-2 [Striga hermonthica]|uniref:Transcription initiation factor IIB-2 n=1 Tax=Striga hermonthica TaxID=68872 RepID=A0A9N7P1U3_STRHE|nr:Transcription initiation factor IIB-2 [Striga hermonthica]